MSENHGDSNSMSGMHDDTHDMDLIVGVAPTGKVFTKSELYQRGKLIFAEVCSHCHQMDGKGIADSIPPLALSDYLMADRKRSINIVMGGLMGEITVNGAKYNGYMPPIMGANENVASILTYVRGFYNGATDSIGTEEVMNVRMGPM